MSVPVGLLRTVAVSGVVVGWAALLVVFRSRRWREGAPKGRARRSPASLLGLAFQGLGFAFVFDFDASAASGLRPEDLSVALGLVLFLPSIWLLAAARRHLGRQWSLQARVLEDHRLVTDGPYRFVRHPIYTGMLGMLVATAFALEAWWQLLPATAAYLLGTLIRIRAEDALLRGTFGEDFDRYAERVPALFPRARGGD